MIETTSSMILNINIFTDSIKKGIFPAAGSGGKYTIALVNKESILILFESDGKKKTQRISIIEVPSNLGKGTYYLFKCPITGKGCRKLRSFNNEFCSLEGWRKYHKVYYPCQYMSKKDRIYDAMHKAEKNNDIIFDKKYTPYYDGKVTRTCRKVLMNNIKIQKGNQIFTAGITALIEQYEKRNGAIDL